MKYFFFSLLLFLGVLLESTIANFPFVLVMLLVGSIMWPKERMLVVGCLIGFFLDSIGFRIIGSTALFFLLMIFLVFLYQQKFEIQTLAFVVGMTAVSSSIYSFLFSYQKIWLQVIISCMIAALLFITYSLIQQHSEKKSRYN